MWIDRYLDVSRPDAGRLLITQWTVHDRARQIDAADAAAAAWREVGWPTGLLGHATFASEDGTTLLQYSQWRDDDAIRAFREGARSAWMQIVDGAVPGIERNWAYETRLYRSMRPGDPRDADRLVVVAFETDGVQAQRAFVDGLIDRVEARTDAHHPGAISSHFHLSVDGTRIFNYSEWRSSADHEEMIRTRMPPDGEIMRHVVGSKGVWPLGFRRYLLQRSLALPVAAGAAVEALLA